MHRIERNSTPNAGPDAQLLTVRRTKALTGKAIESQDIMNGKPVDLDKHRGMAAQRATEIRRERIHAFQADQEALRLRQEELEKLLLAAPAETWPEVAAKAQYLIQLYAATPDAQNARRQRLIALALHDLRQLCDREIADA